MSAGASSSKDTTSMPRGLHTLATDPVPENGFITRIISIVALWYFFAGTHFIQLKVANEKDPETQAFFIYHPLLTAEDEDENENADGDYGDVCDDDRDDCDDRNDHDDEDGDGDDSDDELDGGYADVHDNDHDREDEDRVRWCQCLLVL